MEKFNIERLGPGAWYIIHTFALNAKTVEQINSVHVMLSIIAETFFCLRCREHFKENYTKFPPPKVNKYNELFIWTVELHNRVNIINNKPIVSHKDALEAYNEKNSTCRGDCGSSNSENLSFSEYLIKVLISGDSVKFNSYKLDSL